GSASLIRASDRALSTTPTISAGLSLFGKIMSFFPTGFSFGKNRSAIARLMVATNGALVLAAGPSHASVARKARPATILRPNVSKYSDVTQRIGRFSFSLSLVVSAGFSISTGPVHLLPVKGKPHPMATLFTPGSAVTRGNN